MADPADTNEPTPLSDYERKVGITTLALLAVMLVGALIAFSALGLTAEETVKTLALIVTGVFVGAFGAKKLG